jgi:hypothetical protein
MKVARHFSAGYCPKGSESPVGTTEISFCHAFKRPYRTRPLFLPNPGTKMPGYLHDVPKGTFKDGGLYGGL